MAKLLPLLLAVLGIAAGVGAGHLLRPDAPAVAEPAPAGEGAVDCPPPAAQTAALTAPPAHRAPDEAAASDSEFVEFANKFVVPLVDETSDKVASMVVLAFSLEVAPGTSERIYEREPKLRDAFLRVLFDHANAGGFDDGYLSSAGLDELRKALREIAVTTAGSAVRDVLILDMVKQEV